MVGAGIFGLLLLYAAFGNERLLGQPDAMFGLSNRKVLIMTALLHLVISCALFVTEDSLVRDILAFWLGLNYLAYRAGMIWMNVAAPYPLAQLAGWKSGLGPTAVNILWNLFTVYLVTVGVLILMLEWRIRNRRPQASA